MTTATAPAMTAQQATAELHRQLILPMNSAIVPNVRAITEALDAGADINAPDPGGLPPLLRCLSWPYPSGASMVHGDAIHAVSALLLKRGADLNATTPEGATATDLAHAWKDNQWTVHRLAREAYRRSDARLMAEVSQISTIWPHPGDVADDKIKRQFVVACWNGMMDELRYLLYLYPDAVNWTENTFAGHRSNGLMSAIKHGGHKLNVGELLIARGIDVNHRDSDGMTALHHAIANGNGSHAFIPALIAAGADETIADESGITPLDLASADSNSAAFTALHDAITLRNQQRDSAAQALQNAIGGDLSMIQTRKLRDGGKFKL